jgi:cysteinyl-tRNA synthetase
MEIKLFNSLENKISEIELSSNKVINIYLCGPTVYDHIHIGNLRSVIIFDVLHRLLLSLNIKVNYVQNITDIDDKIIDRAEKEKKDEKKISRHYTKAYFNNLVNYNILFPSHSPRVTNYLPQIKSFINSLLEKGHAYEKEGEILFHIGENKEYGKLSGQNLEKLKTVRNIIQSTKRNEKDFIIWKKSEKGIM